MPRPELHTPDPGGERRAARHRAARRGGRGEDSLGRPGCVPYARGVRHRRGRDRRRGAARSGAASLTGAPDGTVRRRCEPGDPDAGRPGLHGDGDASREARVRKGEPTLVRAVIADDEPLARRQLLDLLADVSWVAVVGEVGDGAATIRTVNA